MYPNQNQQLRIDTIEVMGDRIGPPSTVTMDLMAIKRMEWPIR